jgi:putative endonuclease
LALAHGGSWAAAVSSSLQRGAKRVTVAMQHGLSRARTCPWSHGCPVQLVEPRALNRPAFGLSHGCPVTASEPYSLYRHGRRRPTIHEFACAGSIFRAVTGSGGLPFPAINGTRERMHGGWVYIMTNRPDGTLYIGVTSDLPRRAWEHRNDVLEGFTKRYGLKCLVYSERHEDIQSAILRERTLKTWRRAWKVRLIVANNPNWDDLYDRLA